jgi:hypothetical protein
MGLYPRRQNSSCHRYENLKSYNIYNHFAAINSILHIKEINKFDKVIDGRKFARTTQIEVARCNICSGAEHLQEATGLAFENIYLLLTLCGTEVRNICLNSVATTGDN